ncbi:MAG: hypothetical protein ACXWVS_06370 [Hyphomicrobium sp.]
MTKLAATLTILMVLAPALAFAAEPGKSGPPLAALTLIVAKPVALDCQTKSVVVAEKAANATSGQLKLTLLLKNDTPKPATGSWRIAGVGPEHTGSLGGREAKTCAEACPLRVAVDGNIELWSPAPKGVDQLAAGEKLLLAVVKADTLALRATTFSGKEIESLEEGTCRIGS